MPQNQPAICPRACNIRYICSGVSRYDSRRTMDEEAEKLEIWLGVHRSEAGHQDINPLGRNTTLLVRDRIVVGCKTIIILEQPSYSLRGKT